MPGLYSESPSLQLETKIQTMNSHPWLSRTERFAFIVLKLQFSALKTSSNAKSKFSFRN